MQVCKFNLSYSTAGFDEFLSLESFSNSWKFIQDSIFINELNICLMNRNKIIKLQSLAHYHLLSVKFIRMFKYGFGKGCYIDKEENYVTTRYYYFKIQERKQTCFNWVVESAEEVLARWIYWFVREIFLPYSLLRNKASKFYDRECYPL